MKIKMLIEVEVDAEDMYGGDDDKQAKQWFMENVLLDKSGLLLHSNEIGDTVGVVTALEVYPF